MTSRVRAALAAVHETGVKLAVASGRPAHMLQADVTSLGCMDYYLCSNGAVLYDAAFQPIERHQMDADDVRGAMDALAHLGCAYNCFIGGAAYMEAKNVTYMAGSPKRVAAALGGSLRSKLGQLKREVYRELTASSLRYAVRSVRPYVDHTRYVEKLGCSFPSKDAADQGLAILSELGIFEVARIWEREFEVTAKGVTKGVGARRLLELAGVDACDAMAFGDSANDLPIREAVGRFVAVENASDEVLAVADETCPSVWDDGVAIWLEERLLKGREIR